MSKKFFKKESSESSSEEDSSSEEEKAQTKTKKPAKLDFGESEDSDEQRVVKTTEDKRTSKMKEVFDKMHTHINISDYT